jgi:hypothetical protein
MKQINPKTAHVRWDQGDVTYPDLFIRYVNGTTLQNQVRGIYWQYSRDELNRRSSMHLKGSTGSVSYVPHSMAERVFQMVRRYFYHALDTMEDLGLGGLKKENYWLRFQGTSAGLPKQIRRAIEVD